MILTDALHDHQDTQIPASVNEVASAGSKWMHPSCKASANWLRNVISGVRGGSAFHLPLESYLLLSMQLCHYITSAWLARVDAVSIERLRIGVAPSRLDAKELF